jgi:prolyl oligopeptidase
MAIATMTLSTAAQAQTGPPPTNRVDVTDTYHGVEVVDPYRWLEDQNSPETRAWIEAQNAYTKSVVNGWNGRAAIATRLTQLLKIETISTPTVENGYYFFTKRLIDQDQPVLYRRHGLKGEDKVLVDPNTMSADKNVSVSLEDVSHNGLLIAYGIRHGGQDEVEIRFKNTDTLQDLPDVMPKGRYFGGVAITRDLSGIYYGRQEKDGPRVYYHAMGTDPSTDHELFGKGYDPSKLVGVGLSEDGRYLLMVVYYGSAAQKTEVYVQNLAEKGPIVPIVNDIDAQFSPAIAGDSVYLVTDWNAPNKRVIRVDLKSPGREHWHDIIPTREDASITGLSPVGGKLFVDYLHNVASQTSEFTTDGKHVGDVKLPGIGTASGLSGKWDNSEAFYSFTSFTTPTQILRLDTHSGKEEVWAQLHVPVDPSKFEVKQVFYPSKDGTKIPMFLVYQKGLKLDGARPTLLYGYGGFAVSLTPSFSSRAVLWAENGGVFAIANLRGGGEFGEKWHRAGMLANKQNVFDDFEAAAQWLEENKYTSREKLAIEGGSNGGLLVGAAITQRPELYRAALCEVPLLDMLRYQNFLVARFWVPEYGSSEDAEQFKALYAYSPYQHVVKGTQYPAVMFVTGDSDTRVAPLHARKMTALMQWATGSDKPILLHYDTNAGHSAGQPITKTIEDLADQQSFLFWQLGITPE